MISLEISSLSSHSGESKVTCNVDFGFSSSYYLNILSDVEINSHISNTSVGLLRQKLLEFRKPPHLFMFTSCWNEFWGISSLLGMTFFSWHAPKDKKNLELENHLSMNGMVTALKRAVFLFVIPIGPQQAPFSLPLPRVSVTTFLVTCLHNPTDNFTLHT
jgi:hypothetical protein